MKSGFVAIVIFIAGMLFCSLFCPGQKARSVGTLPVQTYSFKEVKRAYFWESEKLLYNRVWIDSEKVPHRGYVFTEELADPAEIDSKNCRGYFFSINASDATTVSPIVFSTCSRNMYINDKDIHFQMKREKHGDFDLLLNLSLDPYHGDKPHVYYSWEDGSFKGPSVIVGLLR